MSAQVLPFLAPDAPAATPQPAHYSPAPATIRELVVAYLADQQRALSVNTCREKKLVLTRFVETFGPCLAQSVKPSEYRAWLDAQPEWKADNTRWSRTLVVKRLFNWAMNDLRIEANPLRGVHVDPGDVKRGLTAAEVEGLLAHADLAFRRVVQFCRWTGCRRQDICNLAWEWLRLGETDLEQDRFEIPWEYHKAGRRTRKPRLIYLLPPALEVLDEIVRGWLPAITPTGQVFRNSRGGPWSPAALSQRLQSTRAAAGLQQDVVLHALRHTVGNEWVRRGGNLKLLSIFLGHASQRTTEKFYVHADQVGDGVMREAQCLTQPFPADKAPG